MGDPKTFAASHAKQRAMQMRQIAEWEMSFDRLLRAQRFARWSYAFAGLSVGVSLASLYFALFT